MFDTVTYCVAMISIQFTCHVIPILPYSREADISGTIEVIVVAGEDIVLRICQIRIAAE